MKTNYVCKIHLECYLQVWQNTRKRLRRSHTYKIDCVMNCTRGHAL